MKRFGELAVGDLFFFAKKKMKKLDNYNAVTVVDCGKEHFMFFKHDLVKEFVEKDTVVENPSTLKFSQVDLNKTFDKEIQIDTVDSWWIPAGVDRGNLKIVDLDIFEKFSSDFNSEVMSRLKEGFTQLESNSSPSKDILQLQQSNRGLKNSKELQDEIDNSFL